MKLRPRPLSAPSRTKKLLWRLSWAGLIVLLVAAARGPSISAHAELERAEPAADALLSAPPQRMEFWFTERIAGEPALPSIIVLDQSGDEVKVAGVEVDPNDSRHVSADVSGIGTGTYTVKWSVLSADDGHTLSGTYGFRVGSGRAPGAATVAGERPQPWAVFTRWTTFFAASVMAACLIWVSLSWRVAAPSDHRRQLVAATIAGAIGLVATSLEPVFQTRFPPDGSIAPSLSDAIDGLPDAWWFRPRGFVLALVATAVGYVLLARGRRVQLLVNVGVAGGMVALLGLSLTTHAAARQRWDWLSTASVVVHEWSVGLWVGGLAALAIFWTSSRGVETYSMALEPIRVFSRAALPLAAVGLATGIVNSGLILPSLDSLWQSDWGRILIAKVAVMLLVLLLAARHRRWLHRHLESVGVVLRRSVRVETLLAALVVLGGVLLALSAPPIQSQGDLTSVNLAAPLPGTSDSPDVVHLVIDPAVAGENQLRVFVSPADQLNVVSPTVVDRVRVTVTSLTDSSASQQLTLEPDDNGNFVAQGTQFSLDGWWQADVLVRRPGVEDVVVPFYVLLPDPNVNGFDAPPIPSSSSEAQQLVEAAFVQVDSIRSLSYHWRLTSGQGSVATAERRLSVGFDGNPPTSLLKSEGIEILTVGDRTWQRTPGQPWIERTWQDIFPPSEWLAAYDGATGFTLGRQMEVDGQRTRVVTFFVPETEEQIAAWYAFWIDETSGHVVQEVMISRHHYMLYNYSEFDQPVIIAPPDTNSATPQVG